MRVFRTGLIPSGILVLMACNTLSAQEDVPALLVDPSEKSRAELLQAISTALNDAQVTIADDALTRESALIIERTRRRDSRGLPLTGRDFDMPEHFALVKSAGQCVLVHQRTGKRFALAAAKCRAVER